MPANIDRQLADLERRMDKLEASEARLLERPEYTEEEIVEISLISSISVTFLRRTVPYSRHPV